MQIIEKLAIPGEHSLLLQGIIGKLEAVLTVPDHNDSGFIAF